MLKKYNKSPSKKEFKEHAAKTKSLPLIPNKNVFVKTDSEGIITCAKVIIEI